MSGGSATLRRAALVGAALIVAGTAAGSAFDRQARRAPLPGDLRPGFGWLTAQADTQASLNRDDPAAALSDAKRLVRRDPADAEALGKLGTAALDAGDDALAYRAFAVSGTLGWRDASTQFYWLAAALAGGAMPIAVDRADALLRVGTPVADLDEQLTRIEASAQGRTLLATRLRDGVPWATAYLLSMVGDDNQVRADRAATLARAGVPKGRDCTVIGYRISGLVGAEAIDAGYRLGRAAGCVDAVSTTGRLALPFGGGLGNVFDWSLAGDADLASGVDVPPGGKNSDTLWVESAAGIDIVAAQRLLLLQPGRYRITASVRDAEGAPSQGADARLACVGGAAGAATDLIDAAGTFAIPAQSCQAQMLTIHVAGGQASRRLWIGGVTVQRLG